VKHRRELTLALALACLAGGLGACGDEPGSSDIQFVVADTTGASPSQIASYWAEASSDDRLASILSEGEPFELSVLIDSNGSFLLAQSKDVVKDDLWLLDQLDLCAVGHDPGMTGLIWRITSESIERDSVSPRWGETDCLGSPSSRNE